MKCSHRFRKPECKGEGSGLINDFVGTKVLLSKLFSGTSSLDILGVEEHFVSYFEVRRRRSLFVRVVLVTFLRFSDFVFEFLVKLIKIYSELSSAGGR